MHTLEYNILFSIQLDSYLYWEAYIDIDGPGAYHSCKVWECPTWVWE